VTPGRFLDSLAPFEIGALEAGPPQEEQIERDRPPAAAIPRQTHIALLMPRLGDGATVTRGATAAAGDEGRDPAQ
jgi:hypothetical protein